MNEQRPLGWSSGRCFLQAPHDLLLLPLPQLEHSRRRGPDQAQGSLRTFPKYNAQWVSVH